MLTELAAEIDRLVDLGRTVVTETHDRIRLYQLEGPDAIAIRELMARCGLDDLEMEDEGGAFSADQLTVELVGVTISARKPSVPDGVHAVMTRAAFKDMLARPPEANVVWLLGLRDAFETLTVRYCPWEDDRAFEPTADTVDIRRVVRILWPGFAGDAGLGRWLLRDPGAEVHDDWRRVAGVRLGLALAQEVEPDGHLLFRGPPSVRFNPAVVPIADAEFTDLQRATRWVYENDREVESRHGLMAVEVSRASLRAGTIADLADISRIALEGARIAYGFGVEKQSHEALKALSDLRKSVSDETVKLADATRGLAGAVTGAVVGNLGLLIARFTLPAAQPLLIPLGLVLALYVGAVIVNGRHFLQIQRDLRTDWKPKLYRYLSEPEYQKLVDDPARRAERAYSVVSIVGAIMAALLLVAVLCVTFQPDQSLGQIEPSQEAPDSGDSDVPPQRQER